MNQVLWQATQQLPRPMTVKSPVIKSVQMIREAKQLEVHVRQCITLPVVPAVCYPEAGFPSATEELFGGDGNGAAAALEPACFLPGLLRENTSGCCCSWEPKHPGYPHMALDICRQLSLQLMMASHGRATPWHSLSPGVLTLFIDISP